MSIAYDIGFTEIPDLQELDTFMQSLGFKIEPIGKRRNFTRVYVFENENVPREIEFFYGKKANDKRGYFGGRKEKVKSYGNLKTFATEMGHLSLDKRLKIIEEKNIRTQYDYYKHLSPERLKFYETALAIRDKFNAIVLSEQTGEEINPDKSFPDKK